MPQSEQFEALILGSGFGGKLLAWHLAQSGRRTAVVERRWIGGSCPNIACLPSKNEIWSARIAHQAHHAAQFGTVITGSVTTDMAKVRQRKRDMVNREIELHLHNYKTSGAELIMGSGRFVASKTLEVRLNDGGTRVLAGDQVFLNLGTHAAIPPVPGLEAARPLTHIEALDLDYAPSHLVVLGGGYVGLELAQAYRRFGSRVTVIETGAQLMAREDPDVADEVHRILREEGIQFLFQAQTLNVQGRSGDRRQPDRAHPLRRAKDRGQRHPGGGGARSQHRRHRARGDRRRVGCARLYPRQRAAGDDRAQRLGDRGVRRQPAIHARLHRRLSDHPGQFGGRQPQHARAAGSLLHVYRAAARSRRTERTRSTTAKM